MIPGMDKPAENSNAQTFAEGSEVPALDSVERRIGETEIVQCVGRLIRSASAASR